MGTRRKPRRRPTVKIRNKTTWSIAGPWLPRQQSTPNQMALRNANRFWAIGRFLATCSQENVDQEPYRRANDPAKAEEREMFHSRFLRSCGSSLMVSQSAEAMPMRQGQSGPCRESVRRPEIIGFGFGDAGRELAPWLGAGPPVVHGIDNYFPLSVTHWRSHGQDGPGRRGRQEPAD